MSNQMVSVNELSTMAKAVASSKLFGMKTPEEAMALMLIAQAEGMHPAIAVRDYHIIQGKPALKADAMMARFQQAGGKVDWQEVSDNRVSAVFSHPQGGSVTIDWDMDRAKAAQLGGKDMWKKFPRQMLRARVISEGIRTVFPGVVIGVYTPEEVRDFDDKPEPQDRGAAQVVETKTAQPAQDEQISRFKKQADDIRADLKSATSIEELNKVWNDYSDALHDLRDFSETAYETLQGAYNRLAGNLAQAPIENQSDAEAA